MGQSPLKGDGPLRQQEAVSCLRPLEGRSLTMSVQSSGRQVGRHEPQSGWRESSRRQLRQPAVMGSGMASTPPGACRHVHLLRSTIRQRGFATEILTGLR